MKKAVFVVLCALILSLVFGALAEFPGDEVLVVFTVTANPGRAIIASAKLEYDPSALELIPENTVREDGMVTVFSLTDVKDNPPAVRFRVRDGAVPGTYPVSLTVLEATNFEVEDAKEGLVFSGESVTVARPPVPVTVYYLRNTDSAQLRPPQTFLLPAGETTPITAEITDGFALPDGSPDTVNVTVSADGVPVPASVTFWLRAIPEPTEVPMPEPTAEPTSASTEAPPPVAAGDIVVFGSYPQTASGSDMTPIEWRVLKVQDDRALLISRYALTVKPYHTQKKDVTWENCALRLWLNTEFFDSVFDSAERNAVLTVTVDNSPAQGYGKWDTDGGNETRDRVFLLSYAEAWEYLGKNADRACQATEFAKKQGAYISEDNGNSRWWLRSPGEKPTDAARVGANGVLSSSCRVDSENEAVRPALWIDLGSDGLRPGKAAK